MERSRSSKTSSVAARPIPWVVAERPVTYVVDASIVVKWFVPEPDSEAAGELKNRFVRREVAFLAPHLLWYEVGHVLRKCMKSEVGKILSAQTELDALAIALVLPSLSMMQLSVELAVRYRLSMYDASYLAVGTMYGCPVMTTDRKFQDRADDPRRVLSLEDWGKAYA